MGNQALESWFRIVEQQSIGIAPFLREWQSLEHSSNANYPPHNIVKNTENVFILELAVAGFKKHEITVEEYQGTVTIKGTKENFSEDKEDTYQYRGIASRNFSKQFRIAEFFEIVDARLEDGLLSITFMKNIPEAAKPKQIAIK